MIQTLLEFLDRFLRTRYAIVALASVCLLLIAATGYRTYKKYSHPTNTFDWSNRGHSDFHNGVYYPSMAFRDGINPYANEVLDKYPMTCPSRPCPPITYVIHTPFTFLGLKAADVAFFAYNLALLGVLAWLSLKIATNRFELGWWLLLCSILLISRPGHISLFTGYYTLELVIATMVALHYADSRPWVSATGMLIASSKPTYILPLIIMMVARKSYRATFLGIVLCTIAGIGGLAWLAQDSSFSEVIAGIQAGQEAFHEDETEYPINTWTRVDLLGMFAKVINWIPDDKVYLAGMFGLLILPFWVVNRNAQNSSSGKGLMTSSNLVILLSIILGIYHHSYDCLLLFAPWVAVTFFPRESFPEISGKWKMALSLLMGIPLINYASTQSARNALGLDPMSFTWQAITLVNGICLFAALAIAIAHCRQGQPVPEEAKSPTRESLVES